MNKKINWKEIWHKFSGKGYYIALILCAVAIGISGYVYYRHAAAPEDVPAIATKPTGVVADPSLTAKPKTGVPLAGTLVADYAMDMLVYNPTTRDWRVHNGVDIAAEAGAPVLCAADGEIYTVYEDDALGTTVVVRHEGGYVTMYASLDTEVPVKAGDTVTLGQTLGYVGNSALLETAVGDHLHFCVTHQDQTMDPEEFVKLS